MASPRELRRRIKSISGTAQITKAMQMVAASKMRKAQQAAIATEPVCAPAVPHPAQRDDADRGLHPSAAGSARGPQARGHPDRGRQGPLRGAQHQRVPRSRRSSIRRSTVFITAGRKAAQFVARTRRQLAAEFAYGDSPTFPEARAIAGFARDLFLKRRGRSGADRRDALRQHAHAGAGVASSICRSGRSRAEGPGRGI